MKVVKANVILEFEFEDDLDLETVQAYLGDLNDHLADYYGSPQIVNFADINDEDFTIEELDELDDDDYDIDDDFEEDED